MGGKSLVAVLVLALAVLGSCQESELDCYDGPFENVLLDDCVDDCQSYETLAEAEAHCNSITNCGGITKTSYGDHEAISLGVGLYEVRAGPGIAAAQGDYTWIKQVGCTTPDQGAALDDINRLIATNQLHPAQEAGGQICRTYSSPVQGQYLEGCVDECRSFQTLQEAEDHCDVTPDCGGVTHSLYGEGQAWHEGIGPYEVRMGPTLKPSKDGDISWVRVEHDCLDENFETSSHGSYDYDFLSPIESAENSFLNGFMYLMFFSAVIGCVVFVTYKQGHPVTVDYVDRARGKIQQILERRGMAPSTLGSYEAL